jgi:hypothetical protein
VVASQIYSLESGERMVQNIRVSERSGPYVAMLSNFDDAEWANERAEGHSATTCTICAKIAMLATLPGAGSDMT